MEDRGMPTERERYLQEKQGYFTNGQWPATCDGGTLTDVVCPQNKLILFG